MADDPAPPAAPIDGPGAASATPPADAPPAAPAMMDAGLVGKLYLGILAVWVLLPFLWFGTLAQDGLAMHVTARIVADHPGDLYIDPGGALFDVKPAYAEEGCRSFPSEQECDEYLVPFVSPPIALPLVVPLRSLDVDVAMLILRLVASGCLVTGMVIIWRRLAGVAPNAPQLLLATVVLVTPLATAPINLGQTSPLLFLSSILGVGVASHRPIGRAALWAAAIAFKLFPLGLGLLLVIERRWRLLLWTGGILVVLLALASAIGPLQLWPDFLTASSVPSEQAAINPYSSSVEAALHQVTGIDGGLLHPLVLAGRAALVALIVVALRRVDSLDERWAVASLGLAVLMPQSWWHYSWVAIAALAVVIWHRPAPARWVWVLPAYAAAALPVNISNTRGWSVPTLQLLLLSGALLVIAGIARPAPDAASVRVETT